MSRQGERKHQHSLMQPMLLQIRNPKNISVDQKAQAQNDSAKKREGQHWLGYAQLQSGYLLIIVRSSLRLFLCIISNVRVRRAANFDPGRNMFLRQQKFEKNWAQDFCLISIVQVINICTHMSFFHGFVSGFDLSDNGYQPGGCELISGVAILLS